MKIIDLFEFTIVKGTNVSKSDLQMVIDGVYTDLAKAVLSGKKTPEKTGIEVEGFPIYVIRDSTSATFYIIKSSGLIAGMLYCAKPDRARNDDHKFPPIKFISDIVWVSEDLRGKGIGTKFYEVAFKTLGEISSSDNIGTMALSVWKKLSTKYDVKLFRTLSNSANKLGYVDYSWDGYVPSIDGKLITKINDDFVFVIKK